MAYVRGICEEDCYELWKAFASTIDQAVSKVQLKGMSAMLQDPAGWRALGLSNQLLDISIDLRQILRANGHKDAASMQPPSNAAIVDLFI